MSKFTLKELGSDADLPDDYQKYLGPGGGLLNLENHLPFSPDSIKSSNPGMWRYADMLPLNEPSGALHLGEGWTPLVTLQGQFSGLRMKADFLMPSGSYKDRGASVLLNRCRELGIREVIQDSSGNAGASVAAYAASTGIAASIFLPENTSPAKVAQVKAYGATLRTIPGDRKATSEATLEAAKNTFYASHIYNPWFFEGIRTIAYEIWEQNGEKSPDEVVIPAGNGSLLIGLFLGFKAIEKAGCGKLPRLIAVQAENCAPLALPANLETKPTMAEGIAIAHPPRGRQIIETVKESDGFITTVNENEILSAWKSISLSGWLIEPTSAAAIAAASRLLAEGRIKPGAITVATGHGLKTLLK